MNVSVYTLGCRLNQAESEAIAEHFKNAGFSVTDPRHADLVIVNTCTVTSKAEQKARRMIRLFAKDSEVIVTGCYAALSPEEVKALSDRVTVFSLKEKASLLTLPQHIRSAISSGLSLHDAVLSFTDRNTDLFAFDASSFQYHSRAYLKVQDGCDNSCGYCRTTIARGPSVSLDADTVVERALRIEAEGFHEIMLTGVNLTMYDHEGDGLGGLVEKLLSRLGSGMRIRLSSMEPDHVDDRLLDTLSDSRMQPHFHIPIQSASPAVLRRVGRVYPMEHVEYIIERMRKVKDDPFIACDIIAGLPGEDDEAFQLTYDFLERTGFAAMHVFPYSPREGTALWGASDRVEERVRDDRAAKLRKLSMVLSRRYVSRQIGKECEVIVEKEKGGKLFGTTGNYLKVEIASHSEIHEGSLLKGRIVSLSPLVFSY